MEPPLRLLLVSTPMGPIGQGLGGGVELTLDSLLRGLGARGHRLALLAASGSQLAADLPVTLLQEPGVPQASWQHTDREAPVTIPADGLLPRLWQRALALQEGYDRVLNLGYDWLPLWLTGVFRTPLFHLVSMGSVSRAMDEAIAAVAAGHPGRLAFHTAAQAAEFALPDPPRLLANGFDFDRYTCGRQPERVLGWVGRIAPEKGLEDAALAAARLGWPLRVWGLREDPAYAAMVEACVPAGTIEWRGFQPTEVLQAELGACAVLLNTPKWTEAFGNVVVEAMACGVPVVAYRRGGPAELVEPGHTGVLVSPDDVDGLVAAVPAALAIDRPACRARAEARFGLAAFAERVERWLLAQPA